MASADAGPSGCSPTAADEFPLLSTELEDILAEIARDVSLSWL
jgi:hypothetical protein